MELHAARIWMTGFGVTPRESSTTQEGQGHTVGQWFWRASGQAPENAGFISPVESATIPLRHCHALGFLEIAIQGKSSSQGREREVGKQY